MRAVLHARRLVGTGDEAILLVEKALAARTKQLDIADAGCLAVRHQLLEDMRADALSLVDRLDDHFIDHGVQDAVADQTPEADQLLAIVGADQVLAGTQRLLQVEGGQVVLVVPAGGLEEAEELLVGGNSSSVANVHHILFDQRVPV